MTRNAQAMAQGNINFGRPSQQKQNERDRGWQAWGRGMTMLHAILAENKAKIESIYAQPDAGEWLRESRKQKLIA